MSIIPSLVTGITSTSKPFSLIDVTADTIELCSRALIKMCLPLFLYLSHIPLITKLFDSVAPDVYIISSGRTFKVFAILLVHSFINSFASRPILCDELGLA